MLQDLRKVYMKLFSRTELLRVETPRLGYGLGQPMPPPKFPRLQCEDNHITYLTELIHGVNVIMAWKGSHSA